LVENLACSLKVFRLAMVAVEVEGVIVEATGLEFSKGVPQK
jgi:hypothetical protein